MKAYELFHFIAHAQSLEEIKRKVESHRDLDREHMNFMHWNKIQGCRMCGMPKHPAK
jgi:hypothetical protein